MYLIKEKLFDIKLSDLEETVNQAEKYYKQFFPKWGFIACDSLRMRNMKHDGALFEYKVTSSLLDSWKENYPLKVFYGVFPKNSYIPKKYPFEKHTDDFCIIQISFSKKLLNIVRNTIIQNKLSGVLSLKAFEELLDKAICKDVLLAFSKERLIDSLTHELSHYFDDITHNEHIASSVSLLRKDTIQTLGQYYNSKNINRSYMEFNAQIHAISVIKQRFEKSWNKMTIFDVLSKDLSLTGMYRSLCDIDIKLANEWIQKIQKRLSREKMLGSRMTFIPKDNEILLEDFVFGV